jgi:hypothetical protein
MTHFKLSYDAPSDTLYLDWAEPSADQDSTSIVPGVLARVNRHTNAVETLEIIDFLARSRSTEGFDLPIVGMLSLDTKAGPFTV